MNPYALLDPAVAALHHLIVLIAPALPWPGGGGSVALALVLVTLAVRAALLPVAVRTLRVERRRQRLAPRLAELGRLHAGDRQRLVAETARAYREADVPISGGLLPPLVQLPVIATVYRLVVVPTVAGSPNQVLAARLFGAPLAAHWPEVIAAGGPLGAGALAFVALLLALTALAAVSSRELARRADQQPTQPAAAVTRVLRLMPFGTVLFAAISPLAVGVYLLTSTAWTVTERRLLAHALPAR